MFCSLKFNKHSGHLPPTLPSSSAPSPAPLNSPAMRDDATCLNLSHCSFPFVFITIQNFDTAEKINLFVMLQATMLLRYMTCVLCSVELVDSYTGGLLIHGSWILCVLDMFVSYVSCIVRDVCYADGLEWRMPANATYNTISWKNAHYISMKTTFNTFIHQKILDFPDCQKTIGSGYYFE